MNRYSKWMCVTSVFLTAAALVVSRLEELDPQIIIPEGVSTPLNRFEFAGVALTTLAVILVIAAYGFNRRQQYNGLEISPLFPKFTFGAFVTLAIVEFALWVVLAKVTDDVAHNSSDLDFPPIRFWHVWRPLFFSAFWVSLAIGLKGRTGRVTLLIGGCSAVAGLSFLMCYREIYYVYLNYHNFGSQYYFAYFISYFSLGNWDVVRACLIVTMIGVWAFRRLPKKAQ